MFHTIYEVKFMNKVGKAAVYMMGAASIAGLSYYMGLPKSKKNAIKDRAREMMVTDKNFMDELC